jgi:hypothetical protein
MKLFFSFFGCSVVALTIGFNQIKPNHQKIQYFTLFIGPAINHMKTLHLLNDEVRKKIVL